MHGTGRSSWLSGHSFPGPAVLANKSGNIPGPNAVETFSSRTASETQNSKPVLKQCRRDEPEEEDGYEIEPEDVNEREAREMDGDPKPKKKFRKIDRKVPSRFPDHSLTDDGKPQAAQGKSEDEPSAD